jgi:hypothetical protein
MGYHGLLFAAWLIVIKPLVYASTQTSPDILPPSFTILSPIVANPLLNTPQRNLDFGFDFFIHHTHYMGGILYT